MFRLASLFPPGSCRLPSPAVAGGRGATGVPQPRQVEWLGQQLGQEPLILAAEEDRLLEVASVASVEEVCSGTGFADLFGHGVVVAVVVFVSLYAGLSFCVWLAALIWTRCFSCFFISRPFLGLLFEPLLPSLLPSLSSQMCGGRGTRPRATDALGSSRARLGTPRHGPCYELASEDKSGMRPALIPGCCELPFVRRTN